MPRPSAQRRTGVLRVLLLGGTTEAVELARMLSKRVDVAVVSSLAGRVSHPRLPEGIVRVGGFGGDAGLAAYLRDEAIDVVVDATHPYAARISQNAALACGSSAVPLIAFERQRWEMQAADRWHLVPDMRAAASMVDREGSRVFLTIGRQELGAFCGCEKAWFLVRAIDAPTSCMPPRMSLILNRGPYALEDELRLLRDFSINLVVTKNSGGAATRAKIEAARILRIPVVMIACPAKHTGITFTTISEVIDQVTQLTLDLP